MKAYKISNDTKNMVINLLSNINNLQIEERIVNNCHILLNDKEDIVGTISYEKFDNIALIRYFVFKKNITFNDLIILYNSLENELKDKEVIYAIGIINSDEVKDVFINLGFKKKEKDKLYFEETLFEKTIYKDNDIFFKSVK